VIFAVKLVAMKERHCSPKPKRHGHRHHKSHKSGGKSATTTPAATTTTTTTTTTTSSSSVTVAGVADPYAV